MNIRYSEEKELHGTLASLEDYRAHVQNIIETSDLSHPESAIITWKDTLMREGVTRIVGSLGNVQHVVLIGIGGSSLGVEAVHGALGADQTLHVLDAVESYRIQEVVNELSGVDRGEVAICIVSKSGTTTETLTNAEVLLRELEALYGTACYDRVVCIGDPDNPLLTAGSAHGMHTLPMHEAIGGRYSVFTAVGIVPLALLGHDTDALLMGVQDSLSKDEEEEAARGAAMLFAWLKEGVRNVNFFALDSQLQKIGFWYRQLAAESLGKQFDADGEEVHAGFVPTISTPVELHSIGQLYFSGFDGVFTDFVFFADETEGYSVRRDPILAASLRGKTMHEIHRAILDGVLGAYKERELPHRITELEEPSERNLGRFMGSRMLEVMYLAKLLNVNAFDQPNVELYKNITRDILDS